MTTGKEPEDLAQEWREKMRRRKPVYMSFVSEEAVNPDRTARLNVDRLEEYIAKEIEAAESRARHQTIEECARVAEGFMERIKSAVDEGRLHQSVESNTLEATARDIATSIRNLND